MAEEKLTQSWQSWTEHLQEVANISNRMRVGWAERLEAELATEKEKQKQQGLWRSHLQEVLVLEAELATEKAWAKHCFERWETHYTHGMPAGTALDWDAERAEWEKAREKG